MSIAAKTATVGSPLTNKPRTKPPTSALQPWLIWGLAAFFYFYENCLQVSPGVMVPELMRTFQVNATALGNLAAFYFYAYAGMQIPVGVLIDRFGPRRLLTLAIGICALGCLIFGAATSLQGAALGRLLIGFGSAFAVVSCLKIATAWFPFERFALLTGLMLTVGLSGSITAGTPLALLVATTGWRTTMFLLALLGAVLLVFTWHIVRDHPSGKPTTNPTTARSKVKLFAGLKQVISSRQNWLLAFYGGLMFAPTSIFGALWGVPFLVHAYGFSRPAAAALISTLFVGWVIGSPLLGWVSDYLGKRRTTLWWGSIGACLALTCVIYVPNLPAWLLSVLLFSFGFLSSGFLPAFSIIRETNANHYNATALGFMNMLNMVGGAAGQPLVGYLLDLSWQGQLLDGSRLYSLTNYHFALAPLPVMMFISILLIPFIKETYCKAAAGTQAEM